MEMLEKSQMTIGEKLSKRQTTTANTRYGHWLADVHSGSFAPAFTLSVS